MTAPPIKMLALDLDGTVFRNDKTISQHTKDAIAAAIAKGVVVIPATGRALNGLPEEILALEGIQYALTSNGAAIWSLKDRKKLVDLPFSTQDTIAAMELMEAYDCMLDVYLDGKVYTSFSMLAKFLQIPIEQVMACGDGGNDIALLQTAGWGVAMGNAPLEVQQAAKAVTLTNQQDGVAHAIETYILSI